MRGCSAFCKCYTSRSWLENKKPFLYSLKRRHVIISNKIIIICRPANCAASLSHNREVPLTSPSLYLFPPPPKKTRRKLQSRFLKQEMELAFFFFANDGSSVCVKESERQRERGSTLISSIMTHGGGICLRIPHQRRRRVSGGLCIYFPRSSRAAGASAEADDWKETLLWSGLEREDRRNQTERTPRVNTRTQSQNSYKRKLANQLHYQGLALVFAALRGGGLFSPREGIWRRLRSKLKLQAP